MAILPASLASLFRGRSAPLIGLDLGTSSVRMVVLERGLSGQWTLDCCASERLQPGWISSDNVEKPGEVAQAIKRLVKKSGVKTKNVAMALPSSAVMTKRVLIQSDLSAADFEMQVEAEISPYLPWSLEDVNIDYSVLGSGHSANELDVLVAATRQEKIEELQLVIDAAGLKLVAVDIEPYARARAAVFQNVEHTNAGMSIPMIALFNIGSTSTSMHVVRGDDVLFDRELSFGGAQLTQLLERTYSLSPTDAERQKRARDLPSGFEARVFSPYLANLSVEVERGLHFFHGANSQRVSNIVLAGGGSCIQGIARAVSSQTGIPCTLANPFAHLNVKSEAVKKKIVREGPAYLTAMGLALRRVAT